VNLKHLDKIFLVIYFSLFTFFIIAGKQGESFLIESFEGIIAEQMGQGSTLLAKSVKKDLFEGDYRKAWKEVSRSLENTWNQSFIIYDSEKKDVVNDISSSKQIDKSISLNKWNELANNNRFKILISDDRKELLVDTYIRGSYSFEKYDFMIRYLYDVNFIASYIAYAKLVSYSLYLGLFVLVLMFVVYIRKTFKDTFLNVGVYIRGLLEGRESFPEKEKRVFQDYFQEERFLKDFKTSYDASQKKLKANAEKTALGEMAKQVAHDIRSPLAALEAVLKDMDTIPESKRLMIRSASTRIHDIANNLLQRNREISDTKNIEESKSLEKVLLPILIDSILSEKRMQYRSKMEVDIGSELDSSSYGLFAKIQSSEMKRVMSNLLNNAVESIEYKGSVSVRLMLDSENKIKIIITDNGKGIPADILPGLCSEGVTHGKISGSGLGLFHAKNAIESWGGSLDIHSEENVGTQVTVTLPKATAPKTFVQTVKLKKNSNLVIVDDDESIHQIWKGRLESIKFEDYGISVFHFSCPEDVIEWSNNNKVDDLVFLIDYEYIGHELNGLDLIEKLNIEENSFLVTSRFDEKHVQRSCKKMNVGLVPKGMASLIPFSILNGAQENVTNSYSNETIVLLDDDDLIRMIWDSSAKKNALNFKSFSKPEDLLSVLSELPLNTLFYIDSGLSDGVKGENFASELYSLGYLELYLATGHDPENFNLKEYDFLKGIIGKEPPWS